MRIFKSIISFLSLVTLVACGGGGGGGSNSGNSNTALTVDYGRLLKQDFYQSKSYDLEISGKLDGKNVSGSVRQIVSAPSSATFRGQSVLQKTVTTTGTITIGDAQRSNGSTGQVYYNGELNYIGSSDQESYSIVDSNYNRIEVIRQNDTGINGFERFYNNSNVFIGSNYATYVVEAYDSNSLLLKLIERDTVGQYSTQITHVRVSAGERTILFDEINYDNGDYIRRTRR